MAYIYKITNDINNKIYIGKTEFSIEKRFAEHCNDAFKERCEKRPLYAAMRKYGVEHFKVDCIEETDAPAEREIYWINYYKSFGKNGYNATMGGDGKRYLDYDQVVEAYAQYKTVKDVANILGIDEHYVSKILKSKGISILSSAEVYIRKYGKAVKMYDLNREFIMEFETIESAARYLYDNHIVKTTNNRSGRHISEVCHKKRKTAYGYVWEFSNI